MTRVWLGNPEWDYVKDYRPIRWDSVWIERPRLWASAVALTLGEPQTVCDPACGDAAVVMTANSLRPLSHAVLGDLSPDTLNMIPNLPFSTQRVVGDAFATLEGLDSIDAIVLTEILEHLPNPDELLRLARAKAKWLVASSPIVRAGVRDHTEQHMWSFDQDGYKAMLIDTGWQPMCWFTANCTDHPYADGFQVWGCR